VARRGSPAVLPERTSKPIRAWPVSPQGEGEADHCRSDVREMDWQPRPAKAHCIQASHCCRAHRQPRPDHREDSVERRHSGAGRPALVQGLGREDPQYGQASAFEQQRGHEEARRGQSSRPADPNSTKANTSSSPNRCATYRMPPDVRLLVIAVVSLRPGPPPTAPRRSHSVSQHLAHSRRKIIMNVATTLRGRSITRAGSYFHRRIASAAALSIAGCTEWLTRQASTAPD
jgi:hypothetical protein